MTTNLIHVAAHPRSLPVGFHIPSIALQKHQKHFIVLVDGEPFKTLPTAEEAERFAERMFRQHPERVIAVATIPVLALAAASAAGVPVAAEALEVINVIGPKVAGGYGSAMVGSAFGPQTLALIDPNHQLFKNKKKTLTELEQAAEHPAPPAPRAPY